MKFEVNATIDHIGHGSIIVHAHVILVLKVLDLGAHQTFCHRIVMHIHWVVKPWDGLDASHPVNEYILRRSPTNSTITFVLSRL